MKIVHLIARLNKGGTANWLRILIEGTRANGIEVFLFAGHVGSNEQEDEAFASLNARRLKSLGRNRSVFADFKTILQFRKVLKQIKPDILNTHTGKAGLIGRVAAVGLPIKVIHTFHGHLLYGYFSRITTKAIISIEKVLAYFTDSYIAVGNAVRDELIEVGIGNLEEFRVIHPGISDEPRMEKSDARRIFGLEKTGVVIGWLGRLTHIKRPDRLIEIAVSNPNVTFIAGGDGELMEILKSSAPENLKFLGWVNSGSFWSACDIAILTSDNEGLPTSLVEASFGNLPLIASRVGSVEDIVSEGCNGFTFHTLIEAQEFIEVLCNNPEKRIQMGQKSRELSLNEYGIDNFLERHFKIYDELLRLN